MLAWRQPDDGPALVADHRRGLVLGHHLQGPVIAITRQGDGLVREGLDLQVEGAPGIVEGQSQAGGPDAGAGLGVTREPGAGMTGITPQDPGSPVLQGPRHLARVQGGGLDLAKQQQAAE